MTRLLSCLAVVCLLASSCFADLGIDTSAADTSSLSQSDWNCLGQNGYNAATFEAVNGGTPVNNDIQNAVNMAKSAGFNNFYSYAFMCPDYNPNVQTTINNIKNAVSGTGINMLWFDIETPSGSNCWGSSSQNVQYLQNAISAAQQAGFNVGIYSSPGEWGNVMGSSTAFSQYPLWYANPDGSQNFNDYQPFGGWTTPTQKQYSWSGPSACPGVGGLVDSNYNNGGITTQTTTATTPTTTATTGTTTSTGASSQSSQGTTTTSNSGSGPSSQAQTSSAKSSASSGQSSASSAKSSASTGQSSASTGQSSASTGQSSASTGQSSASTGQSSASTGQSSEASSSTGRSSRSSSSAETSSSSGRSSRSSRSTGSQTQSTGQSSQMSSEMSSQSSGQSETSTSMSGSMSGSQTQETSQTSASTSSSTHHHTRGGINYQDDYKYGF